MHGSGTDTGLRLMQASIQAKRLRTYTPTEPRRSALAPEPSQCYRLHYSRVSPSPCKHAAHGNTRYLFLHCWVHFPPHFTEFLPDVYEVETGEVLFDLLAL